MKWFTVIAFLLALSAGCGGSEGVSEEDALRAESLVHELNNNQAGQHGAARLTDWTRQGDDLLTAWLVIHTTGEKDRVQCASVDLAQRIDNKDDVAPALELVPDHYCEGVKPKR